VELNKKKEMEKIHNEELHGLLGCIQKLPDWVDKEINRNKHSLRGNTKGYGGKTH
jgi:hypothetical protein